MRIACIAAALLSAVATSAAADGPYLKLTGGASFLRDADLRLDGGDRAEGSFDLGFAAGAAIGYAFTDNISAEVEYMYRSSDADGFGGGGFATGGDLASVVISAHALYTFDGFEAPGGGRLRPYLGLGLGVIEEVDFDVSGGVAAGEYSDGGRLAFQARVGAVWELGEHWGLSLEGRYLNAGSPTLSRSGGGEDLKVEYEAFDALIGVSYRF
ncbi:MAG: outer membrane beta-barrel protein [Pseudomonadota bacterium]